MGHSGDAKALGPGLYELRIHLGPGYRIYFLRDGDDVIVLLCAGDKSNQQSDINTARQLAITWKEQQAHGHHDRQV